MINIDNTLENVDWLKKIGWDLPFNNAYGLLEYLGVLDKSVEEQISAVKGFISLPAYESAPKKLKFELSHFILAIKSPMLIKSGKTRDVITEALSKLSEIPDAKDGHIAVPWKIKKRPKIEKKRWHKSELKVVNIEELYASQNHLDRSVVEWEIKHPGESRQGHNAFANVLELTDGSKIIYDGHHRLASLWLMGADKATVWYLKEKE